MRAAQSVLASIASLLVAFCSADLVRACSCDWSTDAVTLHDAEIIAGVVINAIGPGPEKDWHLAAAKVRRGWKGVDDAADVKIMYETETSCGRLPTGGTDHGVYSDPGKGYFWPALCMPLPREGLLEAYRLNRMRLEKAAAARPDDLGAQLALARYLVNWNEAKRAAEVLQLLIALAPNDPDVRLLDARHLLDQAGSNSKELHAASAALAQVLEVEPGHTLAMILQAEVGNRARYAQQLENDGTPGNTDVARTDFRGRHLDLAAMDLTGISFRSLDFGAIDGAGSDWSATRVSGDLSGADLTEANLEEADWRGAHLAGASLRRARAAHVNLGNVDLSKVDLRSADLSFAELDGANLAGANLNGANLTGASLYGADLRGADLRNAKVEGLRIGFASGGAMQGRAKIDCDTRLPRALRERSAEFEQVETCESPPN